MIALVAKAFTTGCAHIVQGVRAAHVDPVTSTGSGAGSALATTPDVDRRQITNRVTTVEDTRRVHVIDYAPTRVFRSIRQACRTPVRPAVAVIVDRTTRSEPLAHPRLVRRVQAAPRPATPAPAGHLDFEDQPTMAAKR